MPLGRSRCTGDGLGLIKAAVALIWGAPIAEEAGAPLPDCSRCRRPEMKEARVLWGCDAPTQEAVFVTSCSRCSHDDPNPKCPSCGGSGRREHFRCMSATLAKAGDARRQALRAFLRAYRLLDKVGVLPASGGWRDQSALFAVACSIADEERSYWNRILEEHRAMVRKMSESRKFLHHG